jgi:rubrerythrin
VPLRGEATSVSVVSVEYRAAGNQERVFMDVKAFYVQAVGLERETEVIYRHLAECALTFGKPDVADFFTQMADFSRKHGESIFERAERECGVLPLAATSSGNSPEVPDIAPAAMANCELESAMESALAAENRGVEFYARYARETADSATRELALKLADEERSHVLALERFMGRKPY